jgi:secreted Zn-dependent insulinase-like peptidase
MEKDVPDSKIPEKLLSEPNLTIFHLPITQFKYPKIYGQFKLCTNNCKPEEELNNVRVSFLEGIFCRVFSRLLTEESYLLEMAGGAIKLSNLSGGVKVKIVAFADVFDTALSKVSVTIEECLKWQSEDGEGKDSIENKKVKFEEWKKKTIRGFANFPLNTPYKNSSTHLSSLALKE